jgi:RND family efflux transporter MFP subunit
MASFEDRGNPLRTTHTLIPTFNHAVPAASSVPRVETLSVRTGGQLWRSRQTLGTHWSTRISAGLLTVLLIAGIVSGYFSALLGGDGDGAKAHAAAVDASHASVRRVSIASAQHQSGGQLLLPATLRPYQSTEVFSRVSGYLKSWHVEIGSSVHAGQVLAEIETPEVDQELSQAKAQHQQGEAEVIEAEAALDEAKADVVLSKANYDRAVALYSLAKSTRDRNYNLVQKDAISQQEYDESQRALEAKYAEAKAAEAEVKRREVAIHTRTAVIRSREATVASLAANVKRLDELQVFKQVVAPFDGVVTRRLAETGMLVAAGTSGNRPLFSIAEHDKLRVQIDVPQSFAAAIAEGQTADIVSPEYPGRTFQGRVARTANSVDQESRTLRVEVELDNADHVLLPGGYAEVQLLANRSTGELQIPTSTLMVKPSGAFVASLGGDGRLQIKPIKLGRDHGSHIEVLGGLTGSEQLVVNPADDLTTGEKVEIIGSPSSVEVAAAK